MRNLSLLLSAISALSISTLFPANVEAQMIGAPAWSQTYESKDLGMSLSYSATLMKEDPKRLFEHEFAVFQLQPNSSVVTQSAPDVCSHLVLSLGAGLDRADEKPKKGQPIIPASRGTLTMTEIDRSCLDKKQLEDTIVSALISSTTKVDGMRPLAHLTNYSVQGNTVWWATSAGYLKDDKGKRSPAAGTVIQGTAGAAVNGHFLLWSITANDADVFNRLANISVCFKSPTCPEGFSRLVQFQLSGPKRVETASRE